MADSSWSSSWPARRSSARGTMSQQPRDRQPAALQEPQRGHLALLLGRTVAQIGLEDRLLAHGEDLVAVPLLEQPGTDHAAKHLTGDGLHVAGREPLVAAHHRTERSTSSAHARSVLGRFLVRHAVPGCAGLAPATATDRSRQLASATWWRPVPVAGHRAIGHPGDGGVADAAAQGYQRPWAGLGKAQLVDQLADQPQPTPAKARHRSRARGDGASPVADGHLDPAAADPDGHRDRLRVAGPIQNGVGGGLADGQDQIVDNIAPDGTWHLLQAASDGTPQLGKAGRRAGKRNLHLLPPTFVVATAARVPYACVSTRSVRFSSWRRAVLSRSSLAILPSRSRRPASCCRRLARRALDQLQASPGSSTSSRPSPAATTSSWPWVKPVIE